MIGFDIITGVELGQQENNNGGGNGQPAEQQATIDATKVFEYFDNNEGDLYQYVSKKLGREVNGVDDLVKVEYKEKEVSLPKDVKKYWEWKLDTNGTFDDYMESQRDWKSETKDKAVREYLRLAKGLEGELLDDAMAIEYTATEEDLETDAKKKRINLEMTYREAIKFLDERKAKFNMPKPEIVAQREADRTMAESKRIFSEGMLQAYDQVKELKVGEGVFRMPDDPRAREDFQTVEGIMRRFQKQDGTMDYAKFITALRAYEHLDAIVNTEYDARFAKYMQEQEAKHTGKKPATQPLDVKIEDQVASVRKTFGF